jgi:simple sugar transport system ATP-binding protein
MGTRGHSGARERVDFSHRLLEHRWHPRCTTGTVYLRLVGITKTFPGVLANSSIHLEVGQGEIHAVLGENGAGKSTLMKILYGFYRPDEGRIEVEGRPLDLRAPSDAIRAGIGMVFQNFMLIPAFSVAENIALALPELGHFLDIGDIRRRLAALSSRYGLDVDPDAKVWQLAVGEQQRVEIVKLLVSGARILILDEPTSVLAPHEVSRLFEILDTLRDDGYTILFITHKLKEVTAIADRITVLRRGAVVGTLARAQATEQDLAEMLLGDRELRTGAFARVQAEGGRRPMLEVDEVTVSGDRGRPALVGVSLTVRPGEIVGVAGVTGNGQSELGETILGLRRPQSGHIRLDGADITRWSTAKILAGGVAYIPEDPLRMGVAPGLSIAENMILNDRARCMPAGGLLTDWGAIRREIEARVENFGLAIPRLGVPVGTLSGGNVQRLLLLRELGRRPKLLVAFHPTRGLDVAATRMAHEVLVRSRNAGAGILVGSEDLDELFSISDRLLVLSRGAVVGSFETGQIDPVEVGLLMTGAGRPQQWTPSPAA